MGNPKSGAQIPNPKSQKSREIFRFVSNFMVDSRIGNVPGSRSTAIIFGWRSSGVRLKGDCWGASGVVRHPRRNWLRNWRERCLNTWERMLLARSGVCPCTVRVRRLVVKYHRLVSAKIALRTTTFNTTFNSSVKGSVKGPFPERCVSKSRCELEYSTLPLIVVCYR